ncbi:LacI family DNA-binding transcriptional regulator [Demequina mangrovi]|uniref:Transcriptional regulator, LacI family n=1 Tax=Demequina mangrovi TaxID=1043493 RepID=A0A1H6UUY2_9MICO|nr:LacI family DNA-binding transcriptional regulator [Demequina mangrovi]SEI92140.1 transcriptional regulator, LacI family [Demequina mangrovi]
MSTPSRSAPTIVDVAREAGVSKSLVSLAIRGDAGVSDATRTRILDVADRLGYHSNALARGLVKGRTQVVGLLVSDLSNPYFADVVEGIEEDATATGLGTVIGHGRGSAEVLARRLDEMLDLGVDGVIVISAMLDAETLDRAAARRPLVMVGRPFDAPRRVSVVRNHDEHGAQAAVGHLLGLGHTRIVHVASSRRAAATARRSSYKETMRAAGLEPQVVEAADGGVSQALDLVARDGGPTACFAGNDRIGTALIHDALERRIDVPGAISVVGYDNSEVGRLVRPALTTVEQPREAMGREAMRLLLSRIDGDREVAEVTLEPRLVVRASTGTAR